MNRKDGRPRSLPAFTPPTPRPLAVEHVDPDCTVGKHQACPGWTWADDLDKSTPCECACHDPEPAGTTQ